MAEQSRRRGKLLVLVSVACGLALGATALWAVRSKESSKDTRTTIAASPEMQSLKYDMAFVCAREADRIPPRDAEADQLYQHARWIRNGNLLKDDPAVYPSIERLVRIAAAYGHDKANLALRGMLKKGQAQSPDAVKESVDLVEDLIRRGIPGGYHDMAGYLMDGYGVKSDFDLSIRYYRRAADLGSPDAQFLIGAKLIDARTHPPDIVATGLSMLRCAGEQGHAAAAHEFGLFTYEKDPLSAMRAFQWGVKAGSTQSALRLEYGLLSTDPNEMSYLGLSQPDPERARRYKEIRSILSRYDYRDPKVPEIDEIVPLPPAKLPPWDGKLKWLEALKADVPPPLPTEQRIAEMAKTKGLDPKTGRPLAK